MLEIQKDKSE